MSDNAGECKCGKGKLFTIESYVTFLLWVVVTVVSVVTYVHNQFVATERFKETQLLVGEELKEIKEGLHRIENRIWVLVAEKKKQQQEFEDLGEF